MARNGKRRLPPTFVVYWILMFAALAVFWPVTVLHGTLAFVVQLLWIILLAFVVVGAPFVWGWFVDGKGIKRKR